MKIAIMQPYFFPYLGYFQLISAVDKFIIFDDVQYIAKGWINRNRLLINGNIFLFTIPLEHASTNRNIRDIKLSNNGKWRIKLCQTIRQGYKKSKYFDQVIHLVEEVILDDNVDNISDIARKSLIVISKYLGIHTDIIYSSSVYENQHLRGQDRILNICKLEKADAYINATGGRLLYNRADFHQQAITLKFIESTLSRYNQPGQDEFIPGLSIIDVMMNNSIEDCKLLLDQYQLAD